jgi:hypothetical protein
VRLPPATHKALDTVKIPERLKIAQRQQILYNRLNDDDLTAIEDSKSRIFLS